MSETALEGLYDEDRLLKVESGINGEIGVKIGNQEPFFLFAEAFLARALEAGRESLAALTETPAFTFLDCRVCYRFDLFERVVFVHHAECANHGRY